MQEEIQQEKSKIKNLKLHVMKVLAEYPITRNSDVALMIEIIRKYYFAKVKEIDGVKYIALGSLYDLPREDNIKRLRAKIQNESGLFLPTSAEVRKRRGIKEEAWLNYVKNN